MPLDRRALVSAVAAGASYVAVAAEAHVSLSTLWRWAQADLTPPPSRQPRLKPSKRAAIAADLDAGQMSLRRIAAKHGIHHRTVSMIRDRRTLGGHAPRAHRCADCGARITTRSCLRCNYRLGKRDAIAAA